MNIEPFVYLTVFLFLALLTYFVRWLNEKIQAEINLKDLFGPSEKPDELPDLETPEASTPSREKPISTLSRSTSASKRRARLEISLHNKRDLRHGIVLMTILGPCRALEPQQDVIIQ
jgi:hypothetical protein